MLRLLSCTLLAAFTFASLYLYTSITPKVASGNLTISNSTNYNIQKITIPKSDLQMFNRSKILLIILRRRQRYFYHESKTSYKTRINKEFEYKMKLLPLTPEDLSILGAWYHRNITLEWGRELFPPAPRLSLQCLKHRLHWLQVHDKSRDLDKTSFRRETRDESVLEGKTRSFSLKVTVVIVYYNEDMMLLLRTLTTLVHRTPPYNLLEVLLIDDFSDKDSSEEVKRYAEGMRIPVKLTRNKVRRGIVQSRYQGIHRGLGQVLVILDSHMEVGEGWLPPLLDILTSRPRALAVPSVKLGSGEDETNREAGPLYTVELEHGFGIVKLRPVHAPVAAGEEAAPFTSPALLGGAFAAYREYLEEIYPQGLTGNSWGVENSRISLRSWLCGQGIYISPCSLARHANSPDRTLSRYFRYNVSLEDKLKREVMAEVINFISSKEQRGMMVSRLENIQKRRDEVFEMSREIRAGFEPAEHQCVRDYQWYTDNIMSDYQPMDNRDSMYVGEVRSQSIKQNGEYSLCLQIKVSTVIIYPCTEEELVLEDSRLLQFTKDYKIRLLNNKCWALDGSTDREDRAYIKLAPCDADTKGQQLWRYDAERMWIVHIATDRCVDATGLEATDEVHVTQCTERDGQRWLVQNAPWFYS